MKKAFSSDELLRRAIKLHQSNQLDKASRIYRKVLNADSQCVDGLHFYGLLKYHQGNLEKGVEMISNAIDLDPTYVDAYLNLGNILLKLGEIDETYVCYTKAYELAPDRIEVLGNLAILLKHLNRPGEAEELLLQAIHRKPQWAEGYYNLANTQYVMGKHDTAIDNYRKSIDLNSRLLQSYPRYTQLCYIAGRTEEAGEAYEKWLALEPDNPCLKHMYAAVSGKDIPSRASAAYLKQHFDDYAVSFESSLLDRLEYKGPAVLKQVLQRRLGKPKGDLSTLDSGCGTGLSADVLRPYAESLIGVDISPGMLRQAQAKKKYDALRCEDMVAFMNKHKDSYDLIVSIDALIYFGEIESACAGVNQALRANGWFVFTLERSTEESGYVLNPHGRYAHTQTYAESVLQRSGLNIVELEQCSTRKEIGADVDGWLCVASKPG